MSDDIEGYCRLCAEPRRISEMLSPDKDIAINAKVITKLSWINIDISTTNGLPNTICYPCLELLERTWSFLNNVRSAQEKLIALFLSGAKDNAYEIELGNKDYNHRIPGKPVDENWQIFEELKREIKIENLHENVPTLYPADTVVISEGSQLGIKLELPSHGHDDVIIDSNDDFDRLSTDSDVPLLKKGVKRKRGRPKFKKSKDRDSKENFTGAKPTWDNLACMCATCDADFDSILSLQLHSLQTHDCCCIFKCIQCSKVFPAYRSFIRHMRTHNHALRRCCEFCNKLFMYQPALSSHKAKYHKTVYKTKCCNCGANFDTVEELEDHNKLFNKITKLRRIPNRNKSEDLIDYKCDQCSKVFKSRANLHQHKQLHTERTKEFACHICGKMFYTKGTLGTHLVVHEEKRPFKCIHCPMAFRAKGNLISHLSLHSGLKPFICEQCGKSFRAKRHLVSHSIVHTDLRPYVCDYCNKSFRFKTRLNLHLRQHTGVRPYKCLYCQRDFTNGSNYKKHMKRRHDMDTTTRPVPKIINKKEITTISETIAQ